MKCYLLVSILLVCLLNSAFALEAKDCRCRAQTGKRIIGGNTTNSWPWHLSVGFKLKEDSSGNYVPSKTKIKRHWCGAIVVNENWALTSASCPGLFNFRKNETLKPEAISVGFGSNDLVKIWNRMQFVEVDQIVLHPDFDRNRTKLDANLALLKLKTPLKFNDSLQPACLELDHPRKVYQEPLVGIGFGVTGLDLNPWTPRYTFGNNSRLLKTLTLVDKSTSAEMCQGRDLNETICLKSVRMETQSDEIESMCQGDQGSPLQRHVNGKATVVGLASSFESKEVRFGGFGDRRCDKYCVGHVAYTHLAAPRFLSWIEDTAGDYCH